VAPGETVSGLEDEYALSAGMPRLLYVKKPAPDREPRLGELLDRIQSEDTASYKPFRTPTELAQLVSADLAVLLSERFLTPGAAPEAAAPPAAPRRRHNLPAELSSFVGRERELADVRRALVGSRLVTLAGEAVAGRSASRPVQGSAQIPGPAAERLTCQHLRVVIGHHDHLLLIGQVDPDDRVRRRHQLAKPSQSRVAVAVTPGDATTVAHEGPPPAMGHQARSASGGRPTPGHDTQNVFLCPELGRPVPWRP
jgi:hypothetical protein